MIWATVTKNVLSTDSVQLLRGVGPAYGADLKALGITTVKELLEHLPTRHEDYGAFVSLAQARPDEVVSVKARLISFKSRRSFRKRLSIQEGILSDGKTSLAVVWFNQPYLSDLPQHAELFLRGKTGLYQGRLTLVSPEIIRDREIISGRNRLQPTYPLSGRLTTRQLRFWIKQALPLLNKQPDVLPPYIVEKQKLLARRDALREIHFPSSADQLAAAKKRMAFEELFVLSLYVLRERRALQNISATPIPINQELLQEYVAGLPFTLTTGQRQAAWRIIQDIAATVPMNRLLEGDVGSGKTVVAAMALLAAARAGGQAVLLAPTVILAEQHFATIRALLKSFGVTIGLLAGAKNIDTTGKPTTRALFLKQLSQGKLDIVVATHGILHPRITFKKLTLFVVDEQHRFGVRQRQLLKTKVRLPNHLPHLLSMTATPIPRSLALTLYGDLDLSIIDEKPAGRPVIKTQVVLQKKIGEVYKEIQKCVARKEQAFVLFPLIDKSETLEAKAVTDSFADLKKKLKGLRIAMLHGRMPDEEKNEIMASFKQGAFDVLAATPVIEVGIDVPRATRMLIMSADRFGLAQLHQFRGRIGRSDLQSTCYLCPDSATTATRKRLELMTTTSDGFKLAEVDLELRGPGEIFGTKQHGQVTFKYATVLDSRILAAAKEEAVALLTKDPSLRNWPHLLKRVARVASQLHLE
jgi:ATP-dependent DNA helicase RecG